MQQSEEVCGFEDERGAIDLNIPHAESLVGIEPRFQ